MKGGVTSGVPPNRLVAPPRFEPVWLDQTILARRAQYNLSFRLRPANKDI
ncbi:hypothetical protein NF212_12665 [Parasalinivibrio latis]